MDEESKNEEQDVSYIEKLLKYGSSSSYATHKDVLLLKKHGLFQTLPLIKLYSPSKRELAECLRLKKQYQFTVYVVDSTMPSFCEEGFININTKETSPQILFALNRLKLNSDFPIKSAELSKTDYFRTVCRGVKYQFLSKQFGEEKMFSFAEYLPAKASCFYVFRNAGYRTEFEDILSGEKFYILSNKKIIIKYDIILKKIIFYITKNQINNNLIIYSTKNIDVKNTNDENKKISWSTTDQKLNKKLHFAFENCDQNYYKKYNFIFCRNESKSYTNIQEFMLDLKAGEMSFCNAQKIFVEQFLGVKITGDKIHFSKPKLDYNYILSIDFDGKKFLIARKKNDSNICQITVDGVCYRNFSSFCFRGVENPEIFVEY